MEVASTNNSQFAFKIHTDANKFYTLNTSPFYWIKLKNSAKIRQTILMVAGFHLLGQVLDIVQQQNYLVPTDNKAFQNMNIPTGSVTVLICYCSSIQNERLLGVSSWMN